MSLFNHQGTSQPSDSDNKKIIKTDNNNFPLSSLQQAIWLDQTLHPESINYNIGSITTLEGHIDPDLMAQAFKLVVTRHDALRLIINTVGEPSQYVTETTLSEMEFKDFLHSHNSETEIEDYIEHGFSQPFFLDQDLWRASLIRVNETRWYIQFSCHHLIADGMSMSLLISDIAEIYSSLIRGETVATLPSTSYRDFVSEDLAYAKSERYGKDEKFWLDRYSSLPPPLFKPQANAYPSVKDQEVVWELPEALFQRVEQLAAIYELTTFHFIYALFACYFSKINQIDDIVIGIPLHNRKNARQKKTVGMFASVIPVRVKIDADNSFADVMRKVASELRLCYKHQRLPIAEIQRKTKIQQKTSRSQLFDMTLSYEPYDVEVHMDGATVKSIEPYHRGQHPLAITINQYRFTTNQQSLRKVTIDFNFSAEYLSFDEVTAMKARLSVLLEGILDNASTAVSRLPVLPAEERQRLLTQFNKAPETRQHDGLIHQLFEAQAERTPQAIAAVFEGESLTYEALNRRANSLAHRLLALGVTPNDKVAICLDRSLEMVVGILAILKAGGAYVPLDPVYPLERLEYILQDSSPVVLVTHSSHADKLASAIPALLVDQPFSQLPPDERATNPQSAKQSSDSLAYVIYTSGSTGQPKGVMVEHRNVVRLLTTTERHFNFNPEDVWTLCHSFSFDFSVWELFGALCYGGKLVVVSTECARSPHGLYELICREKVTILNQTPSAFRQLIAAQDETPHSLRCIVFGGESLEMHSLVPWVNQALNQNTRLINMYGITEITVHASFYEIPHADIHRNAGSLIGAPLDDLAIYILDDQGQLVPVGVPGELYIAGAGVTRGYLNLTELTAERFLADPFSKVQDQRMYRTGDLGRWLADGTIEYLGRNDFQVKIRGFRIELGEIEAALSQCEGVSEAVVIARQENSEDKRLVAYLLVEEGCHPEPADLRMQLSQSLAEYMLPAAYVVLDSFPLTPNGKLDRSALPAPDQNALVSHHYVAPCGEMEIALAAVWAELLGVEKVGRHDNFFELGGHSLMMVSLIERLRQKGWGLEIRSAYSAPILAEMALCIKEQNDESDNTPPVMIDDASPTITPDMLPLVTLSQQEIDSVVASVEGGAPNVQDIYPLSPLQEGILFHHLLQEQGDTYLLHSLLAFDTKGRLDSFIQALQQVIDRHDILRTAACWQGISRPVQVVWRKAPLQVNQLAAVTGENVLDKLRALVNPRQRSINLNRAPLFTADIVQDPDNQQWLLALCFHHMVCDHITMALICGEITQILQGNGAMLPTPLPYRDFIARALRVPEGVHEDYFRSQLADIDAPTAPFDLLDIQESGGRTGEACLELERPLVDRIRAGARRLGVSPSILFHTACARMLAQLCGRQDVVFGTVLMGRLQAGSSAESGLGMFINTLPLRLSLAEKSVREAILTTGQKLASLLEHEQAPLALALRCSAVAQPLPLFSTLLNYRHSQADSGTGAWEGMQLLEAEERTNYPITLSVDDMGSGFLLTAQTIADIEPERMLDYMKNAVEGLVNALESDEERLLFSLSILPTAEQHQLLERFNPPATDFSQDRLIHNLFEEQAARTPQAIALVSDETSLTYQELNCRANRLAHRLRALGINPDDRVALCMERSAESVVAMLGILKAGGAYLPIDPATPPARLNFMLADGSPVALVTQSRLLDRLNSALPKVLLDGPLSAIEPGDDSNPDPDHCGLTSSHLAYVIYTSGSTGQPKGVMVEHRNINRLIFSQDSSQINPQDCVAHCANIAFDASTWEIWPALIKGARVQVISQETLLDPIRFSEALLATQVNVMLMTVGLFNQYLDQLKPVFSQLRTLVVGGDALDPRKIAQLQQSGSQPQQLINGYGPTETTTFATTYLIPESDQVSRSIPIGEPLSNTQIYILDPQGLPVPVGVPGELYIAGAGVARGYLNLPELSAERFLADPFARQPGQRMYRSGDLGRWLPDGNIEFLGRNDFQVKIRGFRIELGEIEACLSHCEGVREAVVIVREESPGDKRLVAYLIPKASHHLEPAELRLQLSQSLAEYMLPSAFVMLNAFPLTPNGKLDRRALPAPDHQARVSHRYVAPVGETETVLAAIWGELLGLMQVGRFDNFFELGGHSLIAVQLINRIQAEFLIEIPISTLFTSPILREQAETIFAAQMQLVAGDDIEAIHSLIDSMSPEELAKMMREGTN